MPVPGLLSKCIGWIRSVNRIFLMLLRSMIFYRHDYKFINQTLISIANQRNRTISYFHADTNPLWLIYTLPHRITGGSARKTRKSRWLRHISWGSTLYHITGWILPSPWKANLGWRRVSEFWSPPVDRWCSFLRDIQILVSGKSYQKEQYVFNNPKQIFDTYL